MAQDDVKREDQQVQFLREAQDWAQGHYTNSFRNADQLLDAVVGALHSLELARATGPVDAGEMLQRAIDMLPDERGSYSGRARLGLALAGGPLQTVLRPAQLEAQELREPLQQMALFGETAVLSTQHGTEVDIDNDALVFTQPDRSIAISETGSIQFVRTIPAPGIGLPVILEENVREIIDRFLRFANAVLAHIDPVGRLSHVVVVAKIFDANQLAWRTRAQHAQSPNSVSMGTFGGAEREAVHLSPPDRTRSALQLSASELVDDFTVKLRRQFQAPRRDAW
jgi:hypothetical protein